MKALLHSRKFWLAVWAAIMNIAAFVVAAYFPAKQDLVLVCMTSLDGIIGVVIASIAYEDGKAYDNFSHPNSDPIVEPPESGEPAE